MNPAAAISLVAATLNLSAAIVLFAIARAPGWKAARTFGAIALTAGLYNCCSGLFCVEGLPTITYLVTARLTYLVGHLNTLFWFALAFGGADADWRRMPSLLRRYSVVSLVVAVVVAVTGIHLQDRIDVVEVAWAGVRYHFPVTTPFGNWYGVLVEAQFFVTFAQLLRRLMAGDRDELLQVMAFGAFLCTSVIEVLVANRVIEFLTFGDIGMLLVVLPVSLRVVQRFVADARRLNEWSGRLAGEVREQTDWRNRAQAALAESDRMAALGRMAAGVGHEINNPLTYLTLSLDEIESYLSNAGAPPAMLTAAGHARDGATRIQRVAERLRSYSRRHDERVPVDLRDVVAAAVRVAGPSINPATNTTFSFDLAPRVLGDESRLVQAAVSILTNAAQAVQARGAAGAIRVSTTTNPMGQAILTVEDNGDGVLPEHLSRLGEPYFTTRAADGALGLGLFVARGIADAYGGRVEFQSVPAAGMVVRLVFPGLREPVPAVPAAPATASAPVARPALPVPPSLAPAPPPEPPVVPAQPDAPQEPPADVPARRPADVLPFRQPVADAERPTVLIVDDEPLVAKLLSAILQRTWAVTVAASGGEAAVLLAEGRFDAVLCDLMMPGMSGMDLAELMATRDPEHRRRMLFLTGGAVTEEAEAFLDRPDVRHLTKPISKPELLAALEEFRPMRDPAGPAPEPAPPTS